MKNSELPMTFLIEEHVIGNSLFAPYVPPIPSRSILLVRLSANAFATGLLCFACHFCGVSNSWNGRPDFRSEKHWSTRKKIMETFGAMGFALGFDRTRAVFFPSAKSSLFWLASLVGIMADRHLGAHSKNNLVFQKTRSGNCRRASAAGRD